MLLALKNFFELSLLISYVLFTLVASLIFQVELEVTLPGEGKDRIFLVHLKFVAQVSHEMVLVGRVRFLVIPHLLL